MMMPNGFAQYCRFGGAPVEGEAANAIWVLLWELRHRALTK